MFAIFPQKFNELSRFSNITLVCILKDVKQLKELFPSVEDDVIKAVLEASRGNKDAAINSLLSMQ